MVHAEFDGLEGLEWLQGAVFALPGFDERFDLCAFLAGGVEYPRTLTPGLDYSC